ncbi:MAG: efflux RND transporter periplasmic adaptor subunit [Gemmatimonadota bacterium]|nr:efflux RND transporter periplasmic adaptor subunit [Gemmatimonadota bacterium]MDH4350249.1 efflux RND transporter periplasmic adaptor subunit [Gemmatimonadota bacterium]MDH5196237.1 efflux RND transporter periplasmic adaptor subunit [Gemmatimonadota bacterium]
MRFSRFVATPCTIVCLVVGACGVFGGSSEQEGGADTTATAPDVSASETFSTDIAIPVEAAAVVKDTLVISVSAAAQTAAQSESKLLAQVEGRVVAVHVRENDGVAAGRLLVEIDTTEYALNLARARASYARSEASFRELVLFDDQLTDTVVRAERERVARAKSGLDEAEVSVWEAELRLSRTRVRAPFAGRAASVLVVPGQNVRVGDELASVVDLNPIRVEVQVLESEVGLLAAGRRATVAFAAFPGEEFAGRIATINPMVDRETRTAKVTVVVPNPGGRILPGMYARVSLEARRFPDRILVPRAAVLERDRRTMLFAFEGEGNTGLAKWRYVTTGMANDSLVEIVPNSETEMVAPGERVLVDGHYTLIHDARVRIVANVRESGGRPQ